MTKLRFVLGVGAVLVVGVLASTASAAQYGLCPGTATAISGVVDGNLTITGNRFVDGGQSLTVTGNLTIAPGACLEAFVGSAAIGGNVSVGKGAVFGLGYGPGAYSVGGNVSANQPLSLYLGGVTIRGNVVSNGGGDPFRNFPIKDNTIGGNLIVQGWNGGWIGLLRNHVGGNIVFAKNVAADLTQIPGSDSSEVADNVVSGNLICHDNAPASQIGDSEGGPNVVSGNALGECAALAA